MPEWLSSGLLKSSPVNWQLVLTSLTLSLTMGVLIGQIHQRTRQPHAASASFHATLVLLTVLITLVTQVIGDNVARAFSLVGALSIVRFRTVVRDTKDTAFVIFAVVIGMCAGAGQPVLALLGTVLVGGVAALYHDRLAVSEQRHSIYLVTLKLGWSKDLEQEVGKIIASMSQSYEVESLSTVRQGAALEIVYRIQIAAHASPREVLDRLSRSEGVQSVELKHIPDEV
jgi:uncharacterized membrane protein YhiD involved in acid resistance